MGVRLIASDLDGTLLHNDKSLSPETVEAIRKARELGIHFVPSTGRAFEAVPQNVREIPGLEYVITSNGAAIYSLSRKERIYECLVPEEAVDELLEISMPENMTIEVFIKGVPYTAADHVKDPAKYGATAFGIEYVKKTRHSVDNIREFVAENRMCVDSFDFVCGDQKVLKAVREEIQKKVPDVYVTSSVSHLLEIGNAAAGKGKTLLHLLDILGISKEETMAFGDADNDLDMIQSVKFGIAMGNASERLKEAAYHITDSNEDDGVAKEILRSIGIGECDC